MRNTVKSSFGGFIHKVAALKETGERFDYVTDGKYVCWIGACADVKAYQRARHYDDFEMIEVITTIYHNQFIIWKDSTGEYITEVKKDA